MPVYTYRRADGTTFDIRQRFLDNPLETCPSTGQAVTRVIQPAGIIFKGSGFYVNDNNKANKPGSPANGEGKSKATETAKSESKSESKGESKGKSESKAKETAPAANKKRAAERA